MTGLRVAVVGNTNNFPLMLAEGLREIGCQVTLFVTRTELLHRPEARSPEWRDAYPPWIVDVSSITENDFLYETGAAALLLNYLEPSSVDLCILNDIAISLGDLIRTPYVAFLTGSDLTYRANYKSVRLASVGWHEPFLRSAQGRYCIRRLSDLVTRQRSGLLGAAVVCGAPSGLIPEADALLEEIGVSDAYRSTILMTDLAARPYVRPPRRKAMRIFSGARVVWRQSADARYSALDLKGSDVLIVGFAAYRRAGGKGRLRLPLKGADVPIARAMVANLGIEEAVTWVPETDLTGFRAELMAADIVCDQLGQSAPGMVTRDACAIGRPVLGNLRNDLGVAYFGEAAPGLQASTAREVCERLLWAEHNPKERAQLGRTAWEFASRHFSPARAAQNLLDRVSNG